MNWRINLFRIAQRLFCKVSINVYKTSADPLVLGADACWKLFVCSEQCRLDRTWVANKNSSSINQLIVNSDRLASLNAPFRLLSHWSLRFTSASAKRDGTERRASARSKWHISSWHIDAFYFTVVIKNSRAGAHTHVVVLCSSR